MTTTTTTTTTTTNDNNKRKKLILLRGISGSGKSTLSRKILTEEEGIIQITGDDSAVTSAAQKYIFSTDDYFINRNTGKYEFVGAKIGRAHEWNQNRVKHAMEVDHLDVIIVDNTNTQRWEARPYVVLAQEHGYDVIVREPDTPWRRDAQELAKRNIHGVPVEAIQRMLDRWDEDFSVEAILKSRPPKFAAKRKPAPSHGHQHQQQKKPICKFFLQGTCNRGDSCSFSHEQIQSN